MNYVNPVVRPDWGALDPVRHSKTPLLSRCFYVLLRRKRSAMAVALAVFAMIVAAALLRPVKYTATSLVMISQTQVVSPEQSLIDDRADSGAVETAIEILRSPYLARQLVTTLNLQADPKWGGRAAKSKPKENGVEPAVVEDVMKSINVHRRALSYVVEVSVEAPTAKQAAQMANTLIGLYQVGREELRVNTMQQADSWLTGRLEDLRKEVQEKEAAIAAFRAENGLLKSGDASLSELQISNIQNSVLEARAQVAEMTARYQQVAEASRRGNADTLSLALNSETMKELRAREADLTRRQTDVEFRYTEQHPLVQSGRAELANIRARIAAEVARIASSAANEVEVSRSRLAALESNLESARSQVILDNTAQVHLRELERDAAASRAVYESFLKRYQEIAQQGKLGPSDAMLISAAKAPKSPTSPHFILVLIVALALGGAAGVGSAFLIDALADPLGDPDEIQRDMDVPVIGSIPFVSPAALRLLDPDERSVPDYLVRRPMTRFAESYRMLRASLMVATPDPRLRSVAVTSAVAEEGKSTAALCLTRLAAMAGQRALLIDCDLRNPSLSKYFGIAPKIGLREVLADGVDWRQVIGTDSRTRAHVLPATMSDLDSADLFNREAFRTLLDEVREEYDLVVLNCAPILLVADALFVAAQADRVILTTNWLRTSRSALKSAIEQLGATKASLVGIVLNCVDFRDWHGQLRTSSYYAREHYAGPNRLEHVKKGSARVVPAS